MNKSTLGDIKSGNIGIIHLSYLPLCSLRSLWLNHSDAAGNDMTPKPDLFNKSGIGLGAEIIC
ncbi:MAG: hypothetical protein ACBR50_22220 [Microcoleus sp.]